MFWKTKLQDQNAQFEFKIVLKMRQIHFENPFNIQAFGNLSLGHKFWIEVGKLSRGWKNGLMNWIENF